MKNVVTLLLALCSLLFIIAPAGAAPLNVYVAGFSVVGGEQALKLKEMLPSLLASRLAVRGLEVAENSSQATAIISGSYFQSGSSFSIDAVVKDGSGKIRVRGFEQGVTENDLLPAVTRLAAELSVRNSAEFKTSLAPAAAAVPLAVHLPVPLPTTAVPAVTPVAPLPDIVPAASPVVVVTPADIVRSASGTQSGLRLTGAYNGLALGRTLPDGDREIFISSMNVIQYYHQGKVLRLVQEVKLRGDERVLAIDTFDLDHNGVPELYVTLVRGDQLASQVWIPTEKGLEPQASNLPYYFRVIALDGRESRLYGQQMATDDDFYGGVGEVIKTAKGYELRNPFSLPRFGNLYNFNRFADAAGKKHFVVINGDGYLIVSSDSGEELWRSSDRFGGSETSFQRENRGAGERLRWIFMEQRITVTSSGNIIVPKNSGLFTVGINRAYNKNSLFCLGWNGSLLDEKWHTKEIPSYLADYLYVPEKKELFVLEVVKKESFLNAGASMLSVKKVE